MKQRIKQLVECLNVGAYEREEVVSLALLSALAGESIFLLGLPGVGKSMIARRLKMAFGNSTSFEYLMSRFSTPDEIFGPVSISKLKDCDTYERVVDGYLPTSDIVFLDEIWKAGPAIQNSLLTVLNEKLYHNGMNVIRIPLKGVVSASNELPAKGEGLEALWDRFLIRYLVKPIDSKENFVFLLVGNNVDCRVPSELQISSSEYETIVRAKDEVEVPVVVTDCICSIRDAINEARSKFETDPSVCDDEECPPYISDRRWRKVVSVLKCSAYLNGRKSVDLSDCLLMEHMLWDSDRQIDSIKKLVAVVVAKYLKFSSLDSIVLSDNASLTSPVGGLSTTDGINYSFHVGDDEILVSIEDYNKLDIAPMYGCINGNVLCMSDNPSGFRVRKTKDGAITLNSFVYYLKRSSQLRNGDVETIVSSVTNDVRGALDSVGRLIDDNIFLRNYDSYSYLTSQLNSTVADFKKAIY